MLIWDPDDVLLYLRTMKLDTINLKSLTLKMTILLALFSAQRLQGLTSLWLSAIQLFEKKTCVFYFPEPLKTSRIGKHQEPIVVETFEDIDLCVLRHVQKYIDMTKILLLAQNQLLKGCFS